MTVSWFCENRDLQGDGGKISRVFLAVEVALGRKVAMTRRGEKAIKLCTACIQIKRKPRDHFCGALQLTRVGNSDRTTGQ